MAYKTNINWCDSTWSPIKGCKKISAGCKNCWAERMAARFSKQGDHFFGLTENGVWTGKPILYESHLKKPLTWKRPRRIAVCLMGDLYYEKVPLDWINLVFDTMTQAPQHTFMMLTKHPSRMAQHYIFYHDKIPKNVWFGMTAENQEMFDRRYKHLSLIKDHITYVSAEPLLGPIEIKGKKTGMIVVGGESGPGARPMSAAWALSLRGQCEKQGIKFFFKQGSANNWPDYKNLESFPEDLQVREFPEG